MVVILVELTSYASSQESTILYVLHGKTRPSSNGRERHQRSDVSC